MFIQVVIRLILYTDQYISRSGTTNGGGSSYSSDAAEDEGGEGRNSSTGDDRTSGGSGGLDIVHGIDNTVSILWVDIKTIKLKRYIKFVL